jgi:DNA-binding GntR family transcriptional regulator
MNYLELQIMPSEKTRPGNDAEVNGHSHSSLSYDTYDRLKAKIVSGELEPGTPLTELRLAATLGISRTPIREALRHLEKHGLVTIDQSRGARVSEVSFRDALEVYEIRELAEPYAARLASMNLTPELEQLLQEMLKDISGTPSASEPVLLDFSKRWREQRDPHSLILKAAGNRTLSDMVFELRMRTERAFFFPSRHRRDTGRQEHIQVLKAILDRDPDRAEQMMREHIRNAKANLIHR